MHLSQVLPRLFVGSCPTHADDINHLKTDYGISAILNLQTDHDFDYWDLDWNRLEARCRELTIEVRRIPVRDFDGQDLQRKLPQCVQALAELLDGGQTVYAHCNVGSGPFAERRHRLPASGGKAGTWTTPSNTWCAAAPARRTSRQSWPPAAVEPRRRVSAALTTVAAAIFAAVPSAPDNLCARTAGLAVELPPLPALRRLLASGRARLQPAAACAPVRRTSSCRSAARRRRGRAGRPFRGARERSRSGPHGFPALARPPRSESSPR